MGCAYTKEDVPLEAPPAGCGRNLSAEELAQYREQDKSVQGKWYTNDRFQIMPPRIAADKRSIAGWKPMTLLDNFEQAAKHHGDRLALRVERVPVGGGPARYGTPPTGEEDEVREMATWTWQEYYDESARAACGFLGLGLQKKGSVVVYGFNSPEWFMSFTGSIMAGGCICGVYPNDNKDNVQYKAQHTACNVAVVESVKHLKVVQEAASLPGETPVGARWGGGIPTLRAVVVWSPGKEELIKSFTMTYTDKGERKERVVKVLTWQQLIEGECDQFLQTNKFATIQDAIGAGSAAREEIKPGSCSGYIYTSGTTGKPKAVMVSHDNVTYLCNCVRKVVPEVGTEGRERIISYLPLSHVAGMLMDIAFPMGLTARSKLGYVTVTFAWPSDLAKMTLADRIRAVKPTMFLGVPRVWEKIMDKMKAMAKANAEEMSKPGCCGKSDLDRATEAKTRGKAWAMNKQLGGNGIRPGSCLDHFIDGKVYGKVRERLGLDECKFALTGAAPMDPDCATYFGQLGININEVYGMSECCGATTVSSNAAHVWGSCGFAIPGAEVQVFRAGEHGNCDPNRPKFVPPAFGSFVDLLETPRPIPEEFCGEVCFRGRHIMMGFLANPHLGDEHMREIQKKTEACIDDDGWLHSGDKGAVDRAGMVKITGRFKEIIIPAGGENVSPVPIENSVKTLLPDLVSNVMMVGDKKAYCTAFVTLKVREETTPAGPVPTDELLPSVVKFIQELGGSATTVEQAMTDAKVLDAIGGAIETTNKNPSVVPNGPSSIKAFTILPRDFSESGGQLTATLKLKRSVVEKEHFRMVGTPEEEGKLYRPDCKTKVTKAGKCDYAQY